MKKIFTILIIFLAFQANAADKKDTNTLDLKYFVLDKNGILNNAEEALLETKKNRSDVINESIFLKNNGKFGNEKRLARTKSLKYNKMAQDSANILYLQAISYINERKWSITINNTILASEMDRNMSDVLEVLRVTPSNVWFKILYPRPKDGEIDPKIKIIKNNDGSENLILSLTINEFFNLSTFKVSKGNMIDGNENIKE